MGGTKGRLSIMKERELFVQCDCHSIEHQFLLSYWPDEEDPPMLYLRVHLASWEGFFRRLWAGLRYAFGYKSRYGHWDEALVNAKKASEIYGFLGGFLVYAHKQAEPAGRWNAPEHFSWVRSLREAEEDTT